MSAWSRKPKPATATDAPSLKDVMAETLAHALQEGEGTGVTLAPPPPLLAPGSAAEEDEMLALALALSAQEALPLPPTSGEGDAEEGEAVADAAVASSGGSTSLPAAPSAPASSDAAAAWQRQIEEDADLALAWSLQQQDDAGVSPDPYFPRLGEGRGVQHAGPGVRAGAAGPAAATFRGANLRHLETAPEGTGAGGGEGVLEVVSGGVTVPRNLRLVSPAKGAPDVAALRRHHALTDPWGEYATTCAPGAKVSVITREQAELQALSASAPPPPPLRFSAADVEVLEYLAACEEAGSSGAAGGEGGRLFPSLEGASDYMKEVAAAAEAAAAGPSALSRAEIASLLREARDEVLIRSLTGRGHKGREDGKGGGGGGGLPGRSVLHAQQLNALLQQATADEDSSPTHEGAPLATVGISMTKHDPELAARRMMRSLEATAPVGAHLGDLDQEVGLGLGLGEGGLGMEPRALTALKVHLIAQGRRQNRSGGGGGGRRSSK